MKELETLVEDVQDLLGYEFEDRDLLFQALCHKSYANEQGWSALRANERLEFLGDSVVELAVSHMIFEDFPEYEEGELTKLRAPVVRGKALAQAARRMGLGNYLLLGKGEEATRGREKQSILADAFEAIVGALYLDGGFDIARGMVISCLESMIHEILELGSGDYKSELQELTAKYLGAVPRYSTTEEGPDHYKTFNAVVRVGDRRFGPVPGTSKKEAEQGAARVALTVLGWPEEED